MVLWDSVLTPGKTGSSKYVVELVFLIDLQYPFS